LKTSSKVAVEESPRVQSTIRSSVKIVANAV